VKHLAPIPLYLAVVIGGSYAAYGPTIASGFSRVQTDLGDSVLNHYLLEHTWRVVSDPQYPGTLLSPPFFHPTPMVLGYSENFLGAAPLYWGLRLGLSAELAFSWWSILAAALNVAAFAIVARWLGCNHLLAAFGGYLWAYALVHVWQTGHQQLVPRWWMPFAVYYAWRLIESCDSRSLNRLCACVFLQATCCFYTGWFLAAGLVVFVPVAAILSPGGAKKLLAFVRERRWSVARILGFWGLALGVFFLPYVLANRGHSREYSECVESLPTVAGWLTNPLRTPWHDTLAPHLRPVLPDVTLFCGFGLIVLMLAAAAQTWKSRGNREPSTQTHFIAACLLTASIWFFLTLNISDGISAWWLVRFAPGGQAIRCVSRVYSIVYLFGGLAVVVWLQTMCDRIHVPWKRAVFLLPIMVAVVYEQTGVWHGSYARDEFYPLAERCGASLKGADAGYVIPHYGRFQAHGDLLGMWAGLYADVPVMNGYSGRYPDGYRLFGDDPETELRGWLTGRFRGRVAIVDPEHPDEVRWLVIE
jgi:hypothetical protein